MLIESFLLKIATAVFKHAVVSKVAALAPAIEIYSAFDTIIDVTDRVSSCNDCKELAVCGLNVVSDPLIDRAVDKLLDVGSTAFQVQQRKSGVYVASKITGSFAAPKLRFPVLGGVADSALDAAKDVGWFGASVADGVADSSRRIAESAFDAVKSIGDAIRGIFGR